MIVVTCSCNRCNELFNHYREYPFCRKCDDKIFGTIKDFLREFPKANGQEVSLATNISTKIIGFYIKEGRLDEYKQTLRICFCGASLEEGQTRCSDCSKQMLMWSKASNNDSRNKVLNDNLNSKGFHSTINKRLHW